MIGIEFSDLEEQIGTLQGMLVAKQQEVESYQRELTYFQHKGNVFYQQYLATGDEKFVTNSEFEAYKTLFTIIEERAGRALQELKAIQNRLEVYNN